MSFDAPPGVNPIAPEGQDPRHQLYAQSSWDLGHDWEFDLIWRYVDALPALGVPSYNAMDVRLAWTPRTDLELAVAGRHLLAGAHPEYGSDRFTGNVSTEVEPEVYGMITWRY
jgi:iron complex outermembrane receptor protein